MKTNIRIVYLSVMLIIVCMLVFLLSLLSGAWRANLEGVRLLHGLVVSNISPMICVYAQISREGCGQGFSLADEKITTNDLIGAPASQMFRWRGLTYLVRSDYRNAHVQFEQGRFLVPFDYWTQFWDAATLINLGDRAEAVTIFRRLKSSYALYSIAARLQLAGSFADSIEAYKLAIEITRDQDGRYTESQTAAQSWREMGRAYRSLAKYPEAVIAGREAIIAVPDDPDAMADFALSLNIIGSQREAIFWLQQATVIAPTRADFHLYLANIYLDTHSPLQAELELKLARQWAPAWLIPDISDAEARLQRSLEKQ